LTPGMDKYPLAHPHLAFKSKDLTNATRLTFAPRPPMLIGRGGNPMASVLLAAGEESTSGRVVLRLALEAAGHTVQEVHDGQSVLAQAEVSRPDLLVLDTDLPVYDGFQVLDRLRRHHALRHLPVVVLSTIPRSIASEFARSLGATRYLVRPFTNADLDAAVAAALAH